MARMENGKFPEGISKEEFCKKIDDKEQDRRFVIHHFWVLAQHTNIHGVKVNGSETIGSFVYDISSHTISSFYKPFRLLKEIIYRLEPNLYKKIKHLSKESFIDNVDEWLKKGVNEVLYCKSENEAVRHYVKDSEFFRFKNM